jgi:hypothetical protein
VARRRPLTAPWNNARFFHSRRHIRGASGGRCGYSVTLQHLLQEILVRCLAHASVIASAGWSAASGSRRPMIIVGAGASTCALVEPAT